MAVATEFLYRNYDSSDATISTAYSNELFPTIENVGWAAQAGHIFKEWNTSRDGTGASFDPGDSFPSPASYTTFYAIWEECDVFISYKGSAITTMSASGTEVLETSGTYLTDDITVQYTKSGGGGVTMVSVDVSGLSRQSLSSPWEYGCLVDGSSTVTRDEDYRVVVSCPENSMFVVAMEMMPPMGGTGTVSYQEIYNRGGSYYYAVFAGTSGGSIY